MRPRSLAPEFRANDVAALEDLDDEDAIPEWARTIAADLAVANWLTTTRASVLVVERRPDGVYLALQSFAVIVAGCTPAVRSLLDGLDASHRLMACRDLVEGGRVSVHRITPPRRTVH